MHGCVVMELKNYLSTKLKLDYNGWHSLLREADIPPRVYLPNQSYADQEVIALFGIAAIRLDQSLATVIEDFGEFLVPGLLNLSFSLIKPGWKTLELIEHTEGMIHKVVRLHQPGAEPPELECYRISPQEITMHYSSQRNLCALAKGIIRGVAQHYQEVIIIEETSCRHKGSPECIISIKLETVKNVQANQALNNLSVISP